MAGKTYTQINEIEKVFSKLEKARALVEELETRACDILNNEYIKCSKKLDYLKSLKEQYEDENLKIRYKIEFRKYIVLVITAELYINAKKYVYKAEYTICRLKQEE